MKKSTERLISMFISLILILAAIVIYFDLIQGAYADVSNLRSTIASKSNLVDSQKQVISQLQNLVSTYQGETSFQNNISSILPLSPESASALGILNSLAQVSNLNLNSVSVNNLGESTVAKGSFIKPIGTLAITLNLNGSYENISTFLNYLASDQRLFDVSRLSLSPSGSPNQDVYNLDLTVDTYYQTQ